MLNYFWNRPERILIPLWEHIQLLLIALLFSVLLASIFTILSVKWKRIGRFLLHLCSILYSVPSLALFALLIPLTGLGFTTAILVLVVYNQYLLLMNFLTGIYEVEDSVVEAARGIGLTDMQILFKIQIPLAKPALYGGIRLAVVSTIGIATIASSIKAGGLGDLLFDGLRTMNLNKILWGSVLSASLSVLMNAFLKMIERKTKKNKEKIRIVQIDYSRKGMIE